MKTRRLYEKPTIKEVIIMQSHLLQSASVKDWDNPVVEEEWGGNE